MFDDEGFERFACSISTVIFVYVWPVKSVIT